MLYKLYTVSYEALTSVYEVEVLLEMALWAASSHRCCPGAAKGLAAASEVPDTAHLGRAVEEQLLARPDFAEDQDFSPAPAIGSLEIA